MRRIAVVLAVAWVWTIMAPEASAIWTETISASGGTALDLGAAWGFGTQNSGNPGAVVTGASSGVLQISDTNSPLVGGTIGGSGLVVTEAFQNVIVSATINPNLAGDMNNSVGLAARSDLAGNGYGLIYDFFNSEFHIVRFAAGLPTYIASQGALSLPTNEDYFLKFYVTGNNLAGELYSSQGGAFLTSVATTDATYASGFSGVVVFADTETLGSPVKGVWDNIVSLPEPSALSLSILGAAMFLRRARR